MPNSVTSKGKRRPGDNLVGIRAQRTGDSSMTKSTPPIEATEETASTSTKRKRKTKAAIQVDALGATANTDNDEVAGVKSSTDNGDGTGAKSNGGTKPARSRYNLEDLRLPVDFTNVGVKKVLNKIPVRKPSKQWFVRTHVTMVYQAYIIDLEDDRETYLVLPHVAQVLGSDVAPKEIRLGVTRQGNLFFWPIRVPGPDGRIDDWNDAAMQASHEAIDTWISLKPNMQLGTYTTIVAEEKWPDPDWNAITQGKGLEELLLDIAFRNRVVDSLEHPVALQLLGKR